MAMGPEVEIEEAVAVAIGFGTMSGAVIIVGTDVCVFVEYFCSFC